jgi:uncharacterized protein (TIGR02147 family)
MRPHPDVKVFAYQNYREYLRDVLDRLRETSDGRFSHRFVAMQVGFSPGYLGRILKGEKNLSEKLIQGFTRFLKLTAAEAAYFDALVKFNQCTGAEDAEVYRKRLLKVRIPRQYTVERDQFEYYSHFHHSVIRSLIGILDIGADARVEALGKLLLPPLSGSECRKSVELLLRLGFIRLEQGRYRLADRFISTGRKIANAHVQAFLRQSAELGAVSVGYPPGTRHHSTLTLGVSDAAFAVLQEKISEFRTEIRGLIEADRDPNHVVQIHFQIFPVAKLPGGGLG